MGLAKIIYTAWIKNFNDSDQFERSKVRMLISFTAIGTIISLAYFFIQPYVPFNVPRYVFLLLPILLNGFCFLLFIKLPQRFIAHGLIGSYWLCFVIGSYYSGGIQSLVLPWLCLMPVLASLLINYKNSVQWFVISLVSVVAFAFIGEDLPPWQHNYGPLRYMFSAIGLCLILFLFTNLFDKARYRILQILKVRNDELIRQKAEINRINAELQTKVEEIASKNDQLEKFWNSLIDVAKHNCIDNGILEVALGHIANVTAQNLNVSRVSVWTYHDGTSGEERIECVLAFNSKDNQFFDQSALYRKDNAPYFDAIKRERVIAAGNAFEHADTKDFSESYLKPLQIKSMMDTPFFSDGKLAGVLCIEHQMEVRNWSHEDIMFATSMAEIISLAYRSVTRRTQQEKLKRLSKEIRQQNEGLEERVAQRTKELIDKNLQLAEFAFINAHLIRGPLCRVLGLINLMRYPTLHDDREVNERLQESSKELENVVNKMALALADGMDVTRSEF